MFGYVGRCKQSGSADLWATLAVPKTKELAATPYRHGSKEKAETFFPRWYDPGYAAVWPSRRTLPFRLPSTTLSSRPRHDGTDGTAQHRLGNLSRTRSFAPVLRLTGTWPMRTEGAGRMIG